MTTPIVTVYLPNFNYSQYIEQAIGSVLQQTFRDFELVIIDDGSTDGSREIIARYEQLPEVRVIYQENLGLNRTNNVALRAARGRYIMRLDADDYLDRNALLVMTNELDRDPDLGMVFPDYYYVDASGTLIGQERRHDFAGDVSLYDQPAHGACTMIRAEALRTIEGYSEQYRCQDGYDLWLRMIGRYKVRNINLPLFYYRRHSTNLTENTRLILETRAEIKKTFAQAMNRPPIEAVAIIPERGRRGEPQSQALELLAGKRLMDWTIDAALEAESVVDTVVSSPDDTVLAHVRQRYGARVKTHRRDVSLARENVSLDRTAEEVLARPDVPASAGAYVFLYTGFPLRAARVIDQAINTMRVFDVDSVIGVVPESDMFFRHTGSGLELVGDVCQYDSLRLERDLLYRLSGGIQVVSAAYYRKTRHRMGGRIGHVVLDGASSARVSDASSLQKLEQEIAAGAHAGTAHAPRPQL